MTPEALLTLSLLTVLAYAMTRRKNRKERRAAGKKDLNFAVIHWTPNDHLSMLGALDGGVTILGRPGSGKTSSSGLQLARGIVAYPGSGGLICASSPTDFAMWQRIFKEAGRSGDLIPFGPRHDLRFDLMEFLSSLGCDSRDQNKAVFTIGERQDNDETESGGNGDKFWALKPRQTGETATEVIRQATGRVSIPDIAAFIASAANSPDDLKEDQDGNSAYSKGFQHRCFEEAARRSKEKLETATDPQVIKQARRELFDLQNARTYWWGEWPVMNPATRTSVEAGITATLHVFMGGLVRSLLCDGTSELPDGTLFTPEIMDRGKWIFADCSVGEFGSSGAFLLNSLRYASQRWVLRRDPATWTAPICLWADEAGKISNSADVYFLTESRKYGGFTVFLAQSMKNYMAALPGERGKAQAELLLGCFAHTVAHAIGDPDTADWLSRKAGKQVNIQKRYDPDRRPDARLWDMLTTGFHYTVGGSEHVENLLESKAFSHNLATGGPKSGMVAEAYVLRTGESFSNGENVLLCTFSQK